MRKVRMTEQSENDRFEGTPYLRISVAKTLLLPHAGNTYMHAFVLECTRVAHVSDVREAFHHVITKQHYCLNFLMRCNVYKDSNGEMRYRDNDVTSNSQWINIKKLEIETLGDWLDMVTNSLANEKFRLDDNSPLWRALWIQSSSTNLDYATSSNEKHFVGSCDENLPQIDHKSKEDSSFQRYVLVFICHRVLCEDPRAIEDLIKYQLLPVLRGHAGGTRYCAPSTGHLFGRSLSEISVPWYIKCRYNAAKWRYERDGEKQQRFAMVDGRRDATKPCHLAFDIDGHSARELFKSCEGNNCSIEAVILNVVTISALNLTQGSKLPVFETAILPGERFFENEQRSSSFGSRTISLKGLSTTASNSKLFFAKAHQTTVAIEKLLSRENRSISTRMQQLTALYAIQWGESDTYQRYFSEYPALWFDFIKREATAFEDQIKSQYFGSYSRNKISISLATNSDNVINLSIVYDNGWFEEQKVKEFGDEIKRYINKLVEN